MYEISWVKLGANIKRVREEKGMSVEELAEKAYATEAYIVKAEAGKRRLTLQALMTFCNALDVEPVVLLEGVAEKE